MNREHRLNPRPEVDQLRLGEIYDHTAPFYDGVVAVQQARAKEIAIGRLAREAGERFLEVGVGTGWAFERMLRASGGRGAVGLDLAPGMIEVARRRLIDAGLDASALVLSDATRLPFAGASFPCVLCTYTLDVLPSASVAAVIQEFRRVLRPGGRLVTLNLTPGVGEDASFTDDWQRGYEADPEFYSGARPITLAPLLAEAGLTVIERRYSGRDAGWPSEIVLSRRPL
jgi:ubiquinone/menaquinone biosynthesis C-methylase UbiE